MFELLFTDESLSIFNQLKKTAGTKKGSKQEGLLKQVKKTLKFLAADPRHPGLHTHEYSGLPHPWNKHQKVFEAYVQNKTPGAYRLFWCYGPEKHQITIITILQHP
jgi:hypothetical protein